MIGKVFKWNNTNPVNRCCRISKAFQIYFLKVLSMLLLLCSFTFLRVFFFLSFFPMTILTQHFLFHANASLTTLLSNIKILSVKDKNLFFSSDEVFWSVINGFLFIPSFLSSFLVTQETGCWISSSKKIWNNASSFSWTFYRKLSEQKSDVLFLFLLCTILM